MLRQQLQRDYPAEGRLPSEPELAAQFGVSRGTVRQALTILQQEGIISRRQGSGTYANKHVLHIQARAESAYEFSELIQLAGFEATIEFISADQQPLEAGIADRLEVAEGTQALTVWKLFLADGQPAIYCLDVVPHDLIQEEYELHELRQPIFTFLQKRCGQTAEQILAEIIPQVADEALAERLDMQPGQPLLRFEEVYYNELTRPVLFSRVYYKDEFIRFSILRKKV